MPCVSIQVVYVCNVMSYVQRVELKLWRNCALEKLSIIIIITIIIIIIHGQFSPTLKAVEREPRTTRPKPNTSPFLRE